MPKLIYSKIMEKAVLQLIKKNFEVNKNKIVDTLSNYKIGIANIKATIGPTVTLYEIVPEAGIVFKIKI